ncbi:MAG: acetyl-CoA carboxylase biotin carboxyl carrier protein subunit [Candidatus Aminicenantales bacterium]
MEYEFLVEGQIHRLSLEKKGEKFIFSDGNKTLEADIQLTGSNIISILIEQRSYKIYFVKDKDKRYVYVDGRQFLIEKAERAAEDFNQAGSEKAESDNLMVKAPMPGKVIKINVSEKEKVRKNQTLAIVEAMKMENEIKSSVEGFVKRIYVSPGDLVDSDKPLIELGRNE